MPVLWVWGKPGCDLDRPSCDERCRIGLQVGANDRSQGSPLWSATCSAIILRDV
jgi:hypothetical protein